MKKRGENSKGIECANPHPLLIAGIYIRVSLPSFIKLAVLEYKDSMVSAATATSGLLSFCTLQKHPPSVLRWIQ